MDQNAALTTIAICQLVGTVIFIVASIVLIYAVFSIKKMVSDKVDQAMSRVEPIAEQAKAIAEQARETTDMISFKLDSITSKATTTADSVTDKILNVASKLDTAVSPNMATIAGIVTMAAKAYNSYKESAKSAPKPKPDTASTQRPAQVAGGPTSDEDIMMWEE